MIWSMPNSNHPWSLVVWEPRWLIGVHVQGCDSKGIGRFKPFLDVGLRFSLCGYLEEMCKNYYIALTQLVPNTFQMWTCFHNKYCLPLFRWFYRFLICFKNYDYFCHRLTKFTKSRSWDGMVPHVSRSSTTSALPQIIIRNNISFTKLGCLGWFDHSRMSSLAWGAF